MKAENNNLVITSDKFARSINLKAMPGGINQDGFLKTIISIFCQGRKKWKEYLGNIKKG